MLLPGGKTECERYRKRLKGTGLSGSKQLSLMCLENGVLQGIQYVSREETAPKTRGPVGEWILCAPKWLNANLKGNSNLITGMRKADDGMDGVEPINQKNVLYKCWAYRRDKSLTDPKSLHYSKIGDVILHMPDSLKYFIDPAFARTGLPDFYLDIFVDSCKEGKLTFRRNQKQWMNVLFRPVNSRWCTPGSLSPRLAITPAVGCQHN